MSFRGSKYICKRCLLALRAEQAADGGAEFGTMTGIWQKVKAPEERPSSSDDAVPGYVDPWADFAANGQKKEEAKPMSAGVSGWPDQTEDEAPKPATQTSTRVRVREKGSSDSDDRYERKLRRQQLRKRLMIFAVLILLGVVAYMPQLTVMAIGHSRENQFQDAWIYDMYVWAGRSHILYGRPDDAVELLEAGVKDLPDSPEIARVYFILGQAYLRERDPEKALESYQNITDRWPDHELAVDAAAKAKAIEENEEYRKQMERDREINL